jgi:hypothetical protein
MIGWDQDELRRIGGATELRIAPTAGGLGSRRAVPIWVVRVGDDLVVRSYRGGGGAWFRTAIRSGRASITAGGVQREVLLEPLPETARSAVDAAYRKKYGSGPYVDAMLAEAAVGTTVRLVPTQGAVG